MHRWRFDVKPLQDAIVLFLERYVGLAATLGNQAPFLEELFRSQLYPGVDYPYHNLYEYLMAEGLTLDQSELLMGHLTDVVGRMLRQDNILEITNDLDAQVNVTQTGHLFVTTVLPRPPGQDVLYQQLIERELQAHEQGDYIPPRQRLVW